MATNSNWLDKGDTAWQLTAATLVGLQSVPGLIILYAGIVKSKWAINSAFMAFYAFAAVLLCTSFRSFFSQCNHVLEETCIGSRAFCLLPTHGLGLSHNTLISQEWRC